MPQAEDGSWVDESFYGNVPPPVSSAMSTTVPLPQTLTGEAVDPTGSPVVMVMLPSGYIVMARIPSHITVSDGDTLRLSKDGGSYVVMENLDYSRKANGTTKVESSPGSTVGGSTNSAGSGPSSMYMPSSTSMSWYIYADAGNTTPTGLLDAINDNRSMIRDIQDAFDYTRGYLNDVASRLNTLMSQVDNESYRTSQTTNRVNSIESSVNDTRAAVTEAKDATNKVVDAVRNAGLAFPQTQFSTNVYGGMVTRRNVMTDYATVQIMTDSGLESNTAYVGSFHDIQSGDYVKVDTSAPSLWTIEDYWNPFA